MLTTSGADPQELPGQIWSALPSACVVTIPVQALLLYITYLCLINY